MNFYTRTDLACESLGQCDEAIPGVTQCEKTVGNLRTLELCITREDAALRLGKPIGRYLTVVCGRVNLLGESEESRLRCFLADRLSDMARRLTEKTIDSEFKIFVAGLGNSEMTADAVGPRTVGYLTATRHLQIHEKDLYHSLGCASLSALAPGVLGQTGIETLELLRGAVDHVKPDLVLVIDALAARSCERLASTVQLSDAGIAPGSGVGNHRTAVTRETLGVPVIALGIPTVVNSATLVYDALRQAGIEDVSDPLRNVLENGRSFFVSPKDCDIITDKVSKLLAGAIREAFTGI